MATAGGTNIGLGVKSLSSGAAKVLAAGTGEVVSLGGLTLPASIAAGFGAWQSSVGVRKVGKGWDQIDHAQNKGACLSECTTRDNLRRWSDGVVPRKVTWESVKDWIDTVALT